MGNNAKPLVEVFHRSTSDHKEGSRGLEQVKEAFGSALLGRIRMGSPREEGDRLQGISNDSPRECANNEADSDSQNSQAMRSSSLLQGGNSGNLELSSGMEARLGGVQGSAEKNGMKHDCLIYEGA